MVKSAESRVHTREPSIQGVQVTSAPEGTEYRAQTRNISLGDARLTLETTLGVPDHFVVAFDDGRRFDCQVRWRNLTEVGVEFSDIPA